MIGARGLRAIGVAVAATVGAAAVMLPSPAAGYDFAISVRTVGQGYQERRYGSGGASELLTRRRLTQYLNLSVYNIAPEPWRGPDGDRAAVSFEMGMRFDSDFGQFMLGRPRGNDTIGELTQNQLDLLYAYFQARDLGGRVDLQLGRQLHWDLVDFYAFDGLDARVRLGRYASVQAFGGTEVRGQLPLASPLYEIDGTSVGARDPVTRPAQNEAWRPLYGGALALDEASPVTARLAYRKVLSQTMAAQPGEPDTGVNHESVSLTAETRWKERMYLSGGARYNLLVAAWDDQQLAVRWRLGGRHLLAVEYSYLAPTFDGDSIWNVFGAGAYRDVRASYDLDLGAGWRGHARGFWRRFIDPPGTPAEVRAQSAEAEGGRDAFGGNLGVDGRWGRGRARADGYAESGTGGWKIGGDVSARFALRPNLLDIDGRVTALAWRADGMSQPRDVMMLGTALGALYQMSRKMRLHLLAENNTGTYYRAQIRGLAILEVDVTL